MKGVFDIEWILGSIVFMTTVSFIVILISTNLTILHDRAAADNLRSESFQSSLILLFDKGYPSNWNDTNVQRIGLSTGSPYVLDSAKIDNLRTLCQTNYSKVRQFFNNDVAISIDYVNGGNIINCSAPVISVSRPRFVTSRAAVLDDNSMVKMEFTVVG